MKLINDWYAWFFEANKRLIRLILITLTLSSCSLWKYSQNISAHFIFIWKVHTHLCPRWNFIHKSKNDDENSWITPLEMLLIYCDFKNMTEKLMLTGVFPAPLVSLILILNIFWLLLQWKFVSTSTAVSLNYYMVPFFSVA